MQAEDTPPLVSDSIVLLAERGERQWLIPIQQEPIHIGRSPNNMVCVDESQLAPRHLRIIAMGDEIWAKDMGSPEGFLFNSQMTREALLQPGDQIIIGELHLSILIEKKADPQILARAVREPDYISRAQKRRYERFRPRRRLVTNPWFWISTAVSVVVLYFAFRQH